MAITPLMQLSLPSVQITVGPLWAAMINSIFSDAIDSHDHSPGKGAKITPSGLNINTDLDINLQDLINIRSGRFSSQLAPLDDVLDKNAIYVVAGNLFYNNGSGTPVQITVGGSIAATGAGQILPLVPGAFPYAASITDSNKVLIIATTTPRTITLPAATVQMAFWITDQTGGADTNPITVTPNGSDTINGLNTSRVLRTPWGGWGFCSDGTQGWTMI